MPSAEIQKVQLMNKWKGKKVKSEKPYSGPFVDIETGQGKYDHAEKLINSNKILM